MNLPIPKNSKYGLIALDAASNFGGPIDLGNGFFALPRGHIELPPHWKEWLGSIWTERIERAGLVLVATVPTERPGVLDGDNEAAGRRVDNLFWGMLAAGHLRFEGDGSRLSGAHGDEGIDVRQEARTISVLRLSGIFTTYVSEADCRRAAFLAERLTTVLSRLGMRRLKLAVRTFMLGFSENDLGQRIHQFVRAVADGVANSWRNDEFERRSALFVGSREEDTETCRELYVMRSNAEHFNEPDEKIEPRLPPREGLLRGYRRAFQAEFLARYCFTRVLDRPELWDHLGSKERVDAFWNLPDPERAALWGPPMDLSAALASFDPKRVPDEA